MDKVFKRHGEKEEFDDRKLYASIYYPAREAGYSEEDAEALAEEITEAVQKWIEEHDDNVLSSDEIRDETIGRLEEEDPDVAFLYETHLDLS